jgi:hypothetical protein
MSGIPEEFVFEDRYMSRKKVDKILGNLFGPVDGKWYREVCSLFVVSGTRMRANGVSSNAVTK